MSEGVRDPERFRKDPVGAVRIISAQLSYRIGDCRLPLYVGPKVANKLFELRAIAAERRVRTNQWRMDSQRTECPENWQVVTGNSDRARRRLVWEHAKAKAWGSGQIRDEAGSVAQDASDDELIPPASEQSLADHAPFPNLGSNWNNEKGGNQDETCPNPNTSSVRELPSGHRTLNTRSWMKTRTVNSVPDGVLARPRRTLW